MYLSNHLSLYLSNKESELELILTHKNPSIYDLRRHSWGGLPTKLRSKIWPYLLDIKNVPSIEFTPEEYNRQIEIDFERLAAAENLSETQKQLAVDVMVHYSRNNSGVGYVQGMSDLLLPFISVFDGNKQLIYSAFKSFISKIELNFHDQQQGTQKMVGELELLLKKVDKELYTHLMDLGVDFNIFAFRWFNCFFLREFEQDAYFLFLDTVLTVRDYNLFAVHLGSALLIHFRNILLESDNVLDLTIFLQGLKSVKWEIHSLLHLFGNVYVSISINERRGSLDL